MDGTHDHGAADPRPRSRQAEKGRETDGATPESANWQGINGFNTSFAVADIRRRVIASWIRRTQVTHTTRAEINDALHYSVRVSSLDCISHNQTLLGQH